MPVTNIAAQKIFNQLAPVKPSGAPGDPMMLRVKLDFTADAFIDFDLYKECIANEIAFIQFVYINNKANAAVLTLLSKTIEQDITVKGNTQGWYPVMAADPPMFRVSTVVAPTALVELFFTNVAMPTAQWLSV
jgi:hypothetical protein